MVPAVTSPGGTGCWGGAWGLATQCHASPSPPGGLPHALCPPLHPPAVKGKQEQAYTQQRPGLAPPGSAHSLQFNLGDPGPGLCVCRGSSSLQLNCSYCLEQYICIDTERHRNVLSIKANLLVLYCDGKVYYLIRGLCLQSRTVRHPSAPAALPAGGAAWGSSVRARDGARPGPGTCLLLTPF